MKLHEMVEKQLNEHGPEQLMGFKNFKYLDYSLTRNVHYLTATDPDEVRKVLIKKTGPRVWAKELEGEKWQLLSDTFTVRGN